MNRTLIFNTARVAFTLLGATIVAESAHAQLTFSNGGANTLNSSTGGAAVFVENSAGDLPTTLNVITGAAIGTTSGGLVSGGATIDNNAVSVRVTGSSVVNYSGGSRAAGDLFASDLATVRVSTLAFDDAVLAGSARLNLLPGGRIDDDIVFLGNSHLEMSGGRLDDEVEIREFSTANISGGQIEDDLVVTDNAVVDIDNITIADAIEASGDSITNFSGGTIGNLIVGDRAVVNMSGGKVEGVIQAGPGGTVRATGGELGAEVTASLNARVELLGGTAPSMDLSAQSGGTLVVDGLVVDSMNVEVLAGVAEIAGGSADSLELYVELDGEVSILGGVFMSGDLEARTGSVITIYGKEFSVLGMPAPFGVVPFVAGDIVGTLADGSHFDVTFRRDFGLGNAAQIVLVSLPEPSTGLLAALVISVVGCGRRNVSGIM